MKRGFTLIVVLISVVIVTILFLLVYKGMGDDQGAVKTKINAEKDIEKINQQIKEKNNNIKNQN